VRENPAFNLTRTPDLQHQVENPVAEDYKLAEHKIRRDKNDQNRDDNLRHKRQSLFLNLRQRLKKADYKPDDETCKQRQKRKPYDEPESFARDLNIYIHKCCTAFLKIDSIKILPESTPNGKRFKIFSSKSVSTNAETRTK
jgi:hypothetical protein